MPDEPGNSGEVYEFTLGEFDADERIDQVLSARLPDLSRTHIQKLIRDGKLTVNGKVCDVPRLKFSAGSVAVLTDDLPAVPLKAEGEDIPLDVIYEDDVLLVINKPAGMVVHPAAGNWHGTVVNALLGREPGLDDEDFDAMRPGIVHRLDKDTSGALVIAKTAKALRKLAKSFADRDVQKTYLAIVHGWPSPPVNVVNAPIMRHPDHKRMAIARDGQGREAVTTWKLIRKGLWDGRKVAVMEMQPHTGRTHQIRVHLSYKDYPIVGDKLYNRGRSSPAPRQMLHARRISFPHPVTGERMEFEAPLPDDFLAIIQAFQEAD
ncbi:MAG: RluA family pseudouridine synthase [Lentisphaeria bacterium]|nr:RluA family pseudouridine synthase [Lentisphaeria bacterium]